MQQYALELILKRKIFTARTEGHDHIALRDVTLQLPPGQFSCLIGPSGCGKSTLLNIINGLDPQFEGTLKLAQGAAPARVATLFQTPRLMPWLTVLENVLLVLPAGADSRQRAVELLNQMGLEAVLNAYPSRLSGGMQRRVALARAFAIRPQILLLDEPFVSLDMPVANRLRELLLDMWQQHDSTVLFVTHDLREALALGDRVIFLSAAPGTVVLDMPISRAHSRSIESPAVEQLYRELLATHPQLLAGLVDPDDVSAGAIPPASQPAAENARNLSQESSL
ncbi:MAG: ATP-binding cassette domain-containing protein [Candidatus Competibacteraceae bacterium]|nr:ATP-binding cassette domain-containing protein [Candidatus Competibacteraceae bacterium]